MKNKYWDGENWLIKVNQDNKILYYLDGILHRNDGPAFIPFYSNGSYVEHYFQNGKRHRENKPAIIEYYNDGITVYIEKYIFNGELHRKDGPADINYDRFGNIIVQNYYFNGIKFNPDVLPFEMPIDSEEKEFLFKLKYGVKNVLFGWDQLVGGS